MVKKLLEYFMKKELQKTNKKESHKEISHMSNGKYMIIYLTTGLIKKT